MRIIELTSAEIVSVRANLVPEFVGISVRQKVELGKDEVGIIHMFKQVSECGDGQSSPSTGGAQKRREDQYW